MTRIPVIPIALVLFFFFLVYTLYNLVVFSRVGVMRRHLETEWGKLKPASAEAERLHRELGASVTAEINFYDNFIDPPLEMARILNLVSDSISSSISLSSFKCERKQNQFRLILAGVSESVSQDTSLVEIQNFVTNVKDQMNSFLTPAPADKKLGTQPLLKASVTTTSKPPVDLSRISSTHFTATIQAEGFN